MADTQVSLELIGKRDSPFSNITGAWNDVSRERSATVEKTR